MSSLRSRNGGPQNRKTRPGGINVFAEFFFSIAICRLRLAAAITRTFTFIARGFPAAQTLLPAIRTSSLALQVYRQFPISSRKIEPPSASSKRPILRSSAPVNAAFVSQTVRFLDQVGRQVAQFHFTRGVCCGC